MLQNTYEPYAASYSPGYVLPASEPLQYGEPPEPTPEEKARAEFLAVAPKCNCGIKATVKQAMKGKPENVGKWFYTCEKPRDGGSCQFFKWAADPVRSTEGTLVTGGIKNDMWAKFQERMINEMGIMQRKLDELLARK